MANKKRCTWVTHEVLYQTYHDVEWGVPILNDRLLFELLILEGQQAGLSWITVLRKREAYRKIFKNFEPEIITKYQLSDIKEWMNNPALIRNKLKLESIIKNAKAYLQIQKLEGSFAQYIWSFVKNKPIQNQFKQQQELPVSSDIAKALSKDLKQRGFHFIGETICYAFMQAAGLVNDHLISCFRYEAIKSFSYDELFASYSKANLVNCRKI